MGERYRIRDLFDLQIGRTPARKEPRYWINGNEDWVSIGDLSAFDKYVGSTKERINQVAISECRMKPVPAYTLIMSFKLSIGKTAITERPIYTNEAIMAFNDKHVIPLDLDYLYHLFSSKDWMESSNLAVMGATLNKKTLGEKEIAVPSLDKQEAVAGILNAVQAQIAVTNQMLTKADALVQSRFVEMFGDCMREPLSELCDFYSGGTPSKKKPEYWVGSLPWFSPKDIKLSVLSDSIDHIHHSVIEQTNLKLLSEGTVVVVVRGMILAHDVPIAILEVPSTINQDLKALIPRKQCNPIFLAEAVRNQESLLLAETGSSAHGTKKIDTAVLGSVPIPAVDIALQNEFAEFVTRVESMKSNLTAQRDRLTTLYDSLAQRYFAD